MAPSASRSGQPNEEACILPTAVSILPFGEVSASATGPWVPFGRRGQHRRRRFSQPTSGSSHRYSQAEGWLCYPLPRSEIVGTELTLGCPMRTVRCWVMLYMPPFRTPFCNHAANTLMLEHDMVAASNKRNLLNATTRSYSWASMMFTHPGRLPVAL